MKANQWTPRRRIEEQYRRTILRLLDQYLTFPDSSTLGEITEALVNFSNVSKLFERAVSIASGMATAISVENARSWREAARQGSRGRAIYEGLREQAQTGIGLEMAAIVRENAALISSIPADVRESVNSEISRLQQEGWRASSIAQYLRGRIPELTRSRAALIARTETSKSATALTQVRSRDLGVNWYEWASSEDERVRRSHRLMDKVLVNWDDPPSPETLAGEPRTYGHYHAGNIFNCRCDSYPVLRFEALSWPRRVYWQGKIRTMTLGKFRQLAA